LAKWIALLGLPLAVACGGEPASEAQATPPVSAAGPEAPAPAAAELPPGPRVGLWVLAEGSQRVLENPDRLQVLLDDAKALGATDLFVQVHRGGRAWFDSSLADAGPFQKALAAQGVDPLAALIGRAHSAGLRVHAWVNVLSLAGNREAPLLQRLGPTAVHVDWYGRSLLDYPGLDVPPAERGRVRMGTPAVWLDPGAPGVAEGVAAVFAELAARYPALDGLHLDYIRFPDVLPFSPGSRFGVGLDFGHGAATRARFEAETGKRAPGPDGVGDGEAWDDWRRGQVTRVVKAIRDASFAAQPRLELSAAVSAYPERAYLSLFQDWRGWVDSGLLNFAVAMLYTRDDRLLRYEAGAYTGGVGGRKVWIGLGSWLFAGAPQRAIEQIALVRATSPAGIALFSWDAIAEAPPLREALAESSARGG
jgi:uncharacterized lipoprotein YddW (UPF0748 family)